MHKYSNDFPQTEKHPVKLEKHGDIRIDDYFWLKNREDQKVVTHLKQEAAYADKVLAENKELENKIFEELKMRTKEDESSVPVKKGDYYYYTRYDKGSQYPIVARKYKSLNAPEEIILDENKLAEGQSFCEVADYMISPNHQILAYVVDFVGRRKYNLHFKDLKTGKLLEQKIEEITPDVVWAADNKTLFYVKQDADTLRADTVYKYNLDSGKSEKIYFEKDETFSVSLHDSLTDKFIYLRIDSTLTSETRYIHADKPNEAFKIFSARHREHDYMVTDGDDGFYILSNKNAKNYKILKTDFSHTDEKNWKEIIAHDPKVYIQRIVVFKNYLALEERFNGLSRIRILDKNLKKSHSIAFPDPAYVADIGHNVEYASDILRYDYQSMRIPTSVYDFDMNTHQQVLMKQSEVPTYDSNKYVIERIFIKVRDGAEVPVSILRSKNTPQDGTAPMLVYGYGSYGMSMDAWFSQSRFSLIDRGFVYAMAHIRGGSEMGREWYDMGRTENKKNTFYDFIDVTEALIQKKYAHPKRVFAMGGSAGGLLMGAITNMRPDLFKGIVAQVPFVDVLTSMLDETLPLTTGEYDEWGNPNEKKYYDYIKSYSPYDNVAKVAYPHILATTGFHDSQVQYWEPAKWVAKIRDNRTNNNLVLFKIDMDSGHGGASGRFDSLKETATEYSFILMSDKL